MLLVLVNLNYPQWMIYSHNSSIPSPIPDELKSPNIISDNEITDFINSNIYLFRILEDGKDMYEWKLLFLRDDVIPF